MCLIKKKKKNPHEKVHYQIHFHSNIFLSSPYVTSFAQRKRHSFNCSKTETSQKSYIIDHSHKRLSPPLLSAWGQFVCFVFVFQVFFTKFSTVYERTARRRPCSCKRFQTARELIFILSPGMVPAVTVAG